MTSVDAVSGPAGEGVPAEFWGSSAGLVGLVEARDFVSVARVLAAVPVGVDPRIGLQVLVARQALISHLEAAQLSGFHWLSKAYDAEKKYLPEEAALALGIGISTAASRIEAGEMLVEKLPSTLACLSAGHITWGKARTVIEAVRDANPAICPAVEAAVLPDADGWNVPTLRKKCQAAVIALDPKGAEDRHRKAVARRYVSVRPLDDGMGSLTVFSAAQDIETIFQTCQAMAHAKVPGDDRPVGARRVDVMVEVFQQVLATGQFVYKNPARATAPASEVPQSLVPFLTGHAVEVSENAPPDVDQAEQPAALDISCPAGTPTSGMPEPGVPLLAGHAEDTSENAPPDVCPAESSVVPDTTCPAGTPTSGTPDVDQAERLAPVGRAEGAPSSGGERDHVTCPAGIPAPESPESAVPFLTGHAVEVSENAPPDVCPAERLVPAGRAEGAPSSGSERDHVTCPGGNSTSGTPEPAVPFLTEHAVEVSENASPDVCPAGPPTAPDTTCPAGTPTSGTPEPAVPFLTGHAVEVSENAPPDGRCETSAASDTNCPAGPSAPATLEPDAASDTACPATDPVSELVDQFAGAAADEAHPDDVWPIPDGVPGALGRPDAFPLQNGTAPRINVTVAATTLIGLDDQPGSLDRYGPITAFQARAISLGGDWYRMITDPHTGVLLDLGRTRYRPTQALIDYVCARDRTCRWPGCPQPAMLSELDHEIEYRPGQDTGGTTDPRNLRCLCTRHHHLRHTPGWSITTNPDQTTTVRSPLGTTRTAPAPTANPNDPYPLEPLVPPPF